VVAQQLTGAAAFDAGAGAATLLAVGAAGPLLAGASWTGTTDE
jgi:hypothetical protein